MEICYNALYSLDIKNVLKKFRVCKNVFKGVFAADNLPKYFTRPAAFVVNTDKHNLPGSHWIAMFIDQKNTCFFFDSFGMPPTVEDHVNFIATNFC